MPNPSSGQISLSQINNAGTTTNSMGSLVNELIAGNYAAGQQVSLGDCYYTQTGTLTATLQGTPAQTGAFAYYGQGWSTALSSNGNVMVTGDPNSVTGTSSKVYTFTYSGGSWSQLGTYLTDNVAGFGARVAISADGLTVAVMNGNNKTVYVYQRSGSTYTLQLTSAFPGINPDPQYAGGLALSADGNVLVVGEPVVDKVTTYLRSGSTWTRGPQGSGAGNMGQSVAISADKSLIFAGSPNFGGRGGYIFSRTDFSLTQLATVSNGSSVQGHGWSCGFSADGLTLAMGANGFSSGTQAVVIVKASSASWASQSIQSNVTWGGASSLNGYSLALSADGNVLAIGDPGTTGNNGQVTIVTRSGSTWTPAYYKAGQTVSYNGWSVAIGDNGNVVAGGAMQGPIGYNAGGCVYIYK